jgi:hypothetical protein
MEAEEREIALKEKICGWEARNSERKAKWKAESVWV